MTRSRLTRGIAALALVVALVPAAAHAASDRSERFDRSWFATPTWLGSATSWFSDLLSLFDFDTAVPPPPTSNGEPPPVSNIGVVIDPDGRIPPPPG